GSRARSRAAKLGAHRRRGMFGIPEWAVGVAFIMLAISIGKALAGRLGPPDRQGGPRGRRDLARAVEELQKRVGGNDDAQTRHDEKAPGRVDRALTVWTWGAAGSSAAPRPSTRCDHRARAVPEHAYPLAVAIELEVYPGRVVGLVRLGEPAARVGRHDEAITPVGEPRDVHVLVRQRGGVNVAPADGQPHCRGDAPLIPAPRLLVHRRLRSAGQREPIADVIPEAEPPLVAPAGAGSVGPEHLLQLEIAHVPVIVAIAGVYH